MLVSIYAQKTLLGDSREPSWRICPNLSINQVAYMSESQITENGRRKCDIPKSRWTAKKRLGIIYPAKSFRCSIQEKMHAISPVIIRGSRAIQIGDHGLLIASH